MTPVQRRPERVAGTAECDTDVRPTRANASRASHAAPDPLAPVKRYYRVLFKATQVWVALASVVSGFRGPRFRADLVSHPASAVAGALTFNARIDETTLQRANRSVVDTFSGYIPQHSPGFTVSAEVAFDLPAGLGGHYLPEKNSLRLHAYQLPFVGLHAAIHEYCHAYTSPAFYQALKSTPNERLIVEAITEHIADKIPAYGRLSKAVSGMDSFYDWEKLADGSHLVSAAKRLEDALGEATLLKAYFGGDADAISALSRASVDIFPKEVTRATFQAVRNLATGKDLHCLVGSMKGARVLVADAAERRTFADADAQHCLAQARRIREKIGKARFDQAFYNFDLSAATEALQSVRDEVCALWQPFKTRSA